jgi:hypothetical protein
MRELERHAPAELNDGMAEIAEGVALPAIRQHTPLGDGRGGDPGRLQRETKVMKVRGKPTFQNRQPYANTEHWGRKRRGVVRSIAFVARGLLDTRAAIEHAGIELLNRLLKKHLP